MQGNPLFLKASVSVIVSRSNFYNCDSVGVFNSPENAFPFFFSTNVYVYCFFSHDILLDFLQAVFRELCLTVGSFNQRNTIINQVCWQARFVCGGLSDRTWCATFGV